jgi:hypothetical protein
MKSKVSNVKEFPKNRTITKIFEKRKKKIQRLDTPFTTSIQKKGIFVSFYKEKKEKNKII